MTSTEPFVVEPSVAEFGPDFTATPLESEQPQEPTQTTTRAKNKKDNAKDGKGLFANLGKNSPARSNVRKLTEDDMHKLAERYVWFAQLCKYFHPRLSIALDENAEKCARSWCELAETNVKVRANILAVIDGGQMMGVAMAHAPILVAAMPEKYVEMFMSGIMNMFAQTVRPPQEPDEETPSTVYPGVPFTRMG